MIGRISGTLIEKEPPQIVVDACGVGYELDVPMSTFCNLPSEGNQVALFTHHVVREDAQLLYGFLTKRERDVFRTVIRVNGVGPKMGLALLSGMSVDDLASAVDQGQAGLLTRVPGIGKKTAERLLLELKGKLPVMGGLFSDHSDAKADVLAALMALGYNEREAAAAVKTLSPDVEVAQGIREALRALAH